jgi:filamentous hemagglutinin family protein
MNKNVFRLVYSKHLGMFVPAAETASGNAGKASSSIARSRRRLLAAMMASSFALSASLSMADPLDGLVPGGGSWMGANAPVINGAVMNINQTESKAILNWQQLNLRAGETLNFNQASASWAALNRINSIDPSNIAGNVNALGHVYFINSNGIIFGNGAQINVGSLTASSLNITDTLFKNGVISDPKNPSFSGTAGFVQVDAGANLNASAGGRIMLLAPEVSNAGVINTPEGQTILAAGQKVYLSSSTDPAGLLVEVGTGGTATNLGDIVSKLGNVTMVGLAVNQQGRVSASTSVRANGSVKLLARDTVTVPQNQAVASRGGVLTLAKDSVTKIDVEVADKEEILKSQLTDSLGNKVLGSSKVELSGGVININGSIVAHGGDVSAIARFNPGLSTDVKNPAADAVSATRVNLGSDASIDVSGLDATAPMSRNQLAIQLYSEQLKDTPLLRGTDFLGKTIYVDARKGTDLIAADALEAAKAVKGITISEVMSKAGTVKFDNSLGDVILANGSKVDVSGGSISYEAGFVRESQLLYKGNNIAISAADKSTPYDGFADSYSVTDQKWGVTRSWDLGNRYGQFYKTYTNGSDAGAVSVLATNALLAADLRGFKKEGYYERDAQLLGGSFSFTLNYASGASPSFRFVTDNNSILSSDFSVVGGLDTSSLKFRLGSSLSPGVIQVETTMFSTDKTQPAGGFSRFSLNALAGNIDVKAPIQLSAKGNIELQTMAQINVSADVTSPGGVIAFKGGDTSLGDNIKISTSGIYTNDTLIAGAMLANVVTDAGAITIAENDKDKGGLSVGQGVRIDANAGAWLNSSNQLTAGKGGSITLTGVASLGDTITSAYGFSKGGSLSLTAYRNIQAAGQSPSQSSLASTLWLPENFFGEGGFSQYTIKTRNAGSSILIGDVASTATTILPQTQALLLNEGYRALVSGSNMDAVASPILPKSYLRKPASITFDSVDLLGATFGKITLQENATVKLDGPNSGAGGSIVLRSNEQMSLLGSLIAPAGNISASVISSMNQYPIYDNKLSLFVGPNAVLSAKGNYAVTPSNNGLIKAAISDAGSISLSGGDRAVVVLKEGSLLDVRGVSGDVDVSLQSGYARKTLNGSAGSISITARNGMVLDGDMQASASASGADGSLSLTFAGGDDSNNVYPNGSRTLELTSTKVGRGANIGVDSALTTVNGFGVISAQQIMDAGFGKLTLDVDRGVDGDKILIANQLNLQLQNSLILKTSLLEVANSVTANLGADYIAVGGISSVTPSSGGGSLNLNAKWIDLIGDVAFAGVDKTKLNAQLDIRGRDFKAATTNEGSLITNGALTLTARQIYPVTNGAFRFQTNGIRNSIEVISSDISSTKIPLSAAGLLTLKADTITQGGTLRAPLGQIVLEAGIELILKKGSLTSISAEGQLIPFGLTRLGGLDFFAPTLPADGTPNNDVATDNGVGLNKMQVKKVSISAPTVDMKDGAVIDISGGSDTFAYEWVKGVGGSSNILGQAGTFAVLPNVKKGEYAPFDYYYTRANAGINAGDSIHIAGVKGLADGDYALLPARYALLPGAFMVQASTKAITQATSVIQVDGSTLVSTYKSNGGYTDTNYSAFQVTDASIFHTPKGGVSKALSEYRLTYGNAFFTKLAENDGTSTPRLSSGAGQLVINVSAGLILDAKVLSTFAAGGRGGLVDITSSKIKVVSSIENSPTKDIDYLQLTAKSLNDLKAESLLLGGIRKIEDDGSTQIITGAKGLIFANDSKNSLSVRELISTSLVTEGVKTDENGNELKDGNGKPIIIAKDGLQMREGSSITSEPANEIIGKTKLITTGNGALLAVSSLNDLEFERTGRTEREPAKPEFSTGQLKIIAGSFIHSDRSMVLDSSDVMVLDSSDVRVLGASDVKSNWGTISLGAGKIALGIYPADKEGEAVLKMSDSLLSSFGQLSKVTLNSYKNLEIYSAVKLGNKSLDFTLNTGAVAGLMASSQTATFRANNFILKNSLGAVYESANNISGTSLIVDANNIQLVGGVTNTTSTIAGFDAVQLNADKEITVAGLGTTNINARSTNLKSSRISAATAADFTIAATGAMTTALPTAQATLADASGLGAKLKITASTLTLGGKVDLPSGQLIAKASIGDLTVSATGQLKATSVPVNFDKYTEYTPAGKITLQTDLGNVVVESSGLVDVSGKQASGNFGGDAGTVNIISKGSTTINGNLKGLASAGNKAGSFVLDTNTLPNFTLLNSALNTGGFTNLRDLRVRNGDVTIASGDTVIAKHVILTVDAGKIDLFGTVDTSGSNGGKIEIYTRDNLTLKTGSKLLANGTGQALVAGDSFVGAGGRVLLSSLSLSTSAISAEGNALIDVSGSQPGSFVGGSQQGSFVGEKGSVTMRAYRGASGTTNTVNVDSTATAAVTGADTVRLEGVRIYTSTTFNTTIPNLVSDTNNFYTANPGAGIYNTQNGANVTILPNIEVRSSSTSALADLTITSDLNMRDFFGVLQVGKGGTLTLRSNNNLSINGTLSDGFNGVATNSVLQTGDTFNYNLVAGADFSSANQITTIRSADATKGNFKLFDTKIIRTGTGEINIAAGGNLTMGNESSVIYTVGIAADRFAGFVPPASTTSLTSNGITSASYLTQGGDININVQGDITGKVASESSQQLISSWLFRQGGGTSSKNVSWWVRPDLFKQGVAAMGGGDVALNAGGSISNFSVSVPTTAQYKLDGESSLNGGGNISVTAGNNISSGIYYAGKGNLLLMAGGEIKSAEGNFGTTVALQDASAKVFAVKNAAIETVFNPTLWAQSSVNGGRTGLTLNGDNSFFMTYGQQSEFTITSLLGDTALGLTSPSNITDKTSTGLPNVTRASTSLEIHPSNVKAVSYSRNIKLGRLVISPSDNQNLSLFAFGELSTLGSNLVALSNADVGLLPSVVSPLASAFDLPSALLQLRNSNAASLLNTSDSTPVLVVAKTGSVNMIGDFAASITKGPGLSSSKAVHITAGKDITLNASLQHNNSQDISVIKAGRDLVMPKDGSAKISLAGPGELLVQANNNVSLGISAGIVTVANTLNPALPNQGASITVLAGAGVLGASVADYVLSYINPNGVGPSALRANPSLLAAYRSDTAKVVAIYMRNITGNNSLSEDAAMTQYLALDLDRQSIFAYRHFSSELLASGKGYAESQNHNRGDNAIATLFPSEQRTYKGDLSLYNSQIRTSRDGSVDILTPGGFINAGVPTSSGNNIGIVTERGGAIRAFAETGFQVEQSKIITQYGSDITVWVNNGDIDAGRGSKTALSVPQRVVSTNADGKTTIEAKGAAAGSGIRAQTYDPDGPTGMQVAPPLGSVALIAPRGILNASEAGIAAGNFLAVATQVLGANNITVTGTSSGVPVANTGSVAGAMTGVSNAAADATKSIANDITRQATTNTTVKTPMPSLISVEVIGLGD